MLAGLLVPTELDRPVAIHGALAPPTRELPEKQPERDELKECVIDGVDVGSLGEELDDVVCKGLYEEAEIAVLEGHLRELEMLKSLDSCELQDSKMLSLPHKAEQAHWYVQRLNNTSR